MGYAEEVAEALEKGRQKQTKAPEIKKSPLNVGERTLWGTIGEDPKAKQQFLEKRFNAEDIVKPADSPTKDWAVKNKQGKVFPIDPKGFQVSDLPGDIVEALPSTIQGLLTGVAQGVGTLGGPVGEVALGSGTAALTEALKQKIGRKLSGIDPTVSGEDVRNQALLGAIPLGFLGRTMSSGVKSLVGKSVAPLAEQMTKEIQPLKQLFGRDAETTIKNIVKSPLKQEVAKEVVEPTAIQKLAKIPEPKMQKISDVIPTKIPGDMWEGIVKNKNLQNEILGRGAAFKDNAEQFAEEAGDLFLKSEKDIDKAKGVFYKKIAEEKGFKNADDIPIDVSQVRPNLQQQISDVKKYLSPKDAEPLEKALTQFDERVKDGKLPFGSLKFIQNNLQGQVDRFETKNPTLANFYRNTLTELRTAKNQVLGEESSKYAKVLNFLDEMPKLLRTGKVTGKANLQQTILNLGKESKEGQMRYISHLSDQIKNIPELSEFANFLDRMQMAQIAFQMKNLKQAGPVGLLERNPVTKALANLSGVFNPEVQIRHLARIAKNDPSMALRAESSIPLNTTPVVGQWINRARAFQQLRGRPLTGLPGIPNIPMPNIPGVNAATNAAQRLSIQQLLRDKKQKERSESISDLTTGMRGR